MSLPATKKGYVPRISQLDAVFLNSEAYSLIKKQLLAVVKYTGQNFVTKVEPEIDAALHYAILKYTIGKVKSSVGQQLLMIKYEDSVSTRRLHGYILALVLGKWLKQRAGTVAYSVTKNDRVKDVVNQCVSGLELLLKIFQVLNLLVFLHRGTYTSVVERLFGLKHVSANPGSARRISYTYFTRELLWHGFAELLAFILPMINVQYFHNLVRKLVPNMSEDSSDSADEASVNFASHTTCVVCNQPPVLPHNFGCRHLACYYCIYSKYASDPMFSCPLCGHQIESKVQIVPTYMKNTAD